MQLTTKIKTYLNNLKERRFWRFPDEFIALIQLNHGEQVVASVKKGLARLDGIPKPETGYSFLDIIEIEGPVGKEMHREDEVNLYKAVKIIRKSGCPTFAFKAILPDPKDYFLLLQAFAGFRQAVNFPWSATENNMEWRKGYCSTENISRAEKILNDFCGKDSGRRFKDLNEWDCYLKFKENNAS